MLHDLITGTDLNGENKTRQKFLNSVATFKVDKRQHTKEFLFQHHHVADLHGDRFLVCVKDSESGAAMLYEDGAKVDDPIVISDVHPLKYSAMRAEASAQLKNHLLGIVGSELKKATRKKVGKAKA